MMSLAGIVVLWMDKKARDESSEDDPVEIR